MPLMRILICLALISSILAAGELKLGKPLALKSPTPIVDLLAKPEAHLGKAVQVRGRVTEVCQMMGCWMALADPASSGMIRVKVKDGDIVFPKESVGKIATAEGTLVRFQLTREQAIARAKHEAEEQGRKFDPAKITSGTTIYQLDGSGAVILE
jgi:hypothetical protein